MEEKMLKLMGQLGLLALLIWVLAAALGRKSEATVKAATTPIHRGKGNRWATSPLMAEKATPATFHPKDYGPMTRWA